MSKELPIRETVSIEEVSRRLNRGVTTIQSAMRKGAFREFATAFQTDNGQWVYICCRAAFEHFLAYGQTPIKYEVHIQREDFDTLAKVIMAST